MRTPFDQFAKALVIDRESPFGTSVSEHEIAVDPQSADLAWMPDRKRLPRRPRDPLDRMARVVSLWEFSHKPPTVGAFYTCVRKLLAWHDLRCATARSQKTRLPPRPCMWFISAGRPRSVLRLERFTPMKAWPSGFYSGPIAGSVRLVIVRELPRTRATLLLRLMGAGLTLRRALDDLIALPADAPERILALPHLLKLRILAPTEKDLPMSSKQFLKHTEQLYQQFVHDTEQRGIERGIEQGLTRGRAQGLAPLVRQFTRRVGRPLTDAEHHTLTTRLDTLGPDRLGDVVLDFAPDALSAWLADPDAR